MKITLGNALPAYPGFVEGIGELLTAVIHLPRLRQLQH